MTAVCPVFDAKVAGWVMGAAGWSRIVSPVLFYIGIIKPGGGFKLETEQQRLQQLAQLYGVETSYHDLKGQHQQAGPDALFAVLRCLGLEMENSGDVLNALRECKMEIGRASCRERV